MKISDITEICRKKYLYRIVLFLFVCIGIGKADINPRHKDHCQPPCCRYINAGPGTATTGLVFYCQTTTVRCAAWCKIACTEENAYWQGRQCGEFKDLCDNRCVYGARVPPESPNLCNEPRPSDCKSIAYDLGIMICNQAACLEQATGMGYNCYFEENIF